MITGTTEAGFNYSIDQELLESYDFLDAISKVEKSVIYRLLSILVILTECMKIVIGERQALWIYFIQIKRE